MCSDLVRFIRTVSPLLPRRREADSSHPRSVLLRHSYERDKSSSSSSPPTSYPVFLRRREISKNCFVAPRSIVYYRNCASSCERSIGKMDRPVRDPASEQLNNYKRTLKVRDHPHACHTQLQRCSNAFIFEYD